MCCVLSAFRGRDPLYLKCTKMKRKVANAGKLRLSPNEEACVLKDDYERRRKLRLLQVREQERGFASRIREDVKQRRSQQFARLAEELRTEWEEAQIQKIRNLEKLCLASLRNMGEGHRQAKENEPDVGAVARRAAERRRRAEMRHREALKVQKAQREVLMKQKTWRIQARKEALLVEKERSAKMSSLPPPVPAPFESIEVKKISSLKTNSSTYHHISTFVSRQMDTKQPDAHLAAEEEAKRLEKLQKQAMLERGERCERAHVRGSQAMKKIHLAQTQDRLMKELRQLQQEDLVRRRQTVAQMPPRLVQLPYKRSEAKEDWQRELEFAFEDMYNADRKVKGNLILHLEPEPLPTVVDPIQDEELDLSVEQEHVDDTEPLPVAVPLAVKTQQTPSKILFKRLLNKIRSQKSLWTINSMSENGVTNVSETKTETSTSVVPSREAALSTLQQQGVGSDSLTIESGPFSSDVTSFPCRAGSEEEEAMSEALPIRAVTPTSVLLHPKEEALRVRMSSRHKQIMEIEDQKQRQLQLLEQIEQQKLRLETDFFRAFLEEEKKLAQQTEVDSFPASYTVISDEDSHRQMIHDYQQRLLQQNRLHKQSVETARKRLLEYQTQLKERCPPPVATALVIDSTTSLPPRKPEGPTAVSEHWDQNQRLRLSPNKCRPVSPRLDQHHSEGPRQDRLSQEQGPRQDQFPQEQVLKQDRIPQGQVEAVSSSYVLTKKSLDSQDHLPQSFQVETQQRSYELFPRDSSIFSRTLSSDRLQTLQDAGKIPETFGTVTFQTLDSQHILPESSENVSSKPAELALFLPLVPEHSFTSLPVKVDSGQIQEPFSTMSKSSVSTSQSLVGHVHDQPALSSETVTAQHSRLRALQEQLELQKEILQARQGAQQQLFLYKQKELEKQTGDSFASLLITKAESGRIQESPAGSATISSGSLDTLWGFSHPILPQQNNLEFPKKQLEMRRDSMQARREAQEILSAHKQSEPGQSEQAGPSLPHQVAQHPFSSLPLADGKAREIQGQPLLKSERRPLPSQSGPPRPRDGPSSFLQQFLPLQDNLKLLQEQLTTQRESLQAQHDAHLESLLRRHRGLGDSKLGPVSSLISQWAAQHADASQAVAEAEPRFQRLFPSQRELLGREHLSSPQHSLPRGEVGVLPEHSQVQRLILGAREETQQHLRQQGDLGRGIPSQHPGPLPSSSQAAESERFLDFMLPKSDNTGPLNHCKIPEERLRFSHMLPLQDNLEERYERVGRGKEVFGFSQQTQTSSSSEQTGVSSFTAPVGQAVCVTLPSADSVTTQGSPSTESDSKASSSRLQIPELQDRLCEITRLIQPQQDNLKGLQDQLAAQRENILQCRQKAHEEILSHMQRGWKGRVSPQKAWTSRPLVAQHSFAPLPLSDSERTEDLSSVHSTSTVSGPSEVPPWPERALGLSHSALSQPEHMHAPTGSFPPEKAQEELVLPRPLEGETCSKHFIHSHGDLQALQQQLDGQRKAIRCDQEIQEELLLQRLNKLQQRVSSEKVSSSSFLSQVLPGTSSEEVRASFPTTDDQAEIPGSHDELSLEPFSAQQDNLTLQLGFEREVMFPSEKSQQKLLLNQQHGFNESETATCAGPPLCVPKDLEHSFIPLPFAEAKPKSMCELHSRENEDAGSSEDLVTPRLQDRLLSYAQSVCVQQGNSGIEKQLNLQREVLQARQRAQEELHVQKQSTLQQQIQKHQEILKDFFHDYQVGERTVESHWKPCEMEQLRVWLPHLRDLVQDAEERWSSSDRSQPHSQCAGAEQSGEQLDHKLSRRASKPPVTKVKHSLDLNQHELSTIQEIESPTSGRASIPGVPDFCQDRDPLRVSVSREQSFLGSPLALANSGGDGHDELVLAMKSDVENHAVLSRAASEEAHTYLGPAVTPDDKAETQEIFPEPLSSITVSTGSFLSYGNTDLSLTDPESFSEHTDLPEQDSTASRQEETSPSSPVAQATQVVLQQQHSSGGAQEPLFPAAAGDAPLFPAATGSAPLQQIKDKRRDEAHLTPKKRNLQADPDFPELQHIFPNLHRQLFKPLEPHLDLDLSFSGISQDTRDFYQSSESSSEKHASTSSINTALIAPKTILQPSLHIHTRADTTLAGTERPEQSFQQLQQLLPEFSSQDSQHTDLPSIHSIEARDASQGMESYNCPETTQIKKGVRFQLSTGDLSSVFGLPDAPAFDQLRVQHSTPCDSTSSESSVKLGSQVLGFQESLEVVTVLQSQKLAGDGNGAFRVLAVNPPVGDSDSQVCKRTIEMVHLSHSSCSQNESLENSTKSESLSEPAQDKPQSRVPIWGTEYDLGIMEEPEITLISISDVSTAETDFANLTLEEKTADEANSCLQVGGFLRLAEELSDQAAPQPSTEQHTAMPTDESWALVQESAESTPQSTSPIPEYAVTTGNLQEGFVKRKKSFVERSYQRQREMRNKSRTSENSQTTTSENVLAGSSLSGFKGVRDVRVSLPEERKTAQALMHQRALRLYNQLAEVKQQREERAKQEAYAQNRARAKEFHQKTLEKLRAKNI